MSEVDLCIQKGFNSFSKLKKHIKKNLIELYNSLNQADQTIPFYMVGFSIYKKINNYYETRYSINIYTNKQRKISISENDFSGFIFDKLSGTQELIITEKENKELGYLNEFFEDMYNDGNEKCLFIKTKELSKMYFVQILVITAQRACQAGAVKNTIRETLEEFLSRNENILRCIPYSDIRVLLKKGINILREEYVMIIDLIRQKDRFKDKYKCMDALITSKMIFEIKKIAGELNFKSINNTGDGFIFVYRGEKENISNDIQLFLQRS